MRSLGLIALIAFIVGSCGARMATVTPPTAVEGAFIQQHPTAQNVAWSMDPHDHYRVQFRDGTTDRISLYNRDGRAIGAGTRMDWNTVPGNIRDAHQRSNFGTWTMGDVYRFDTPSGQPYYSIDVRNADAGHTIYYDHQGAVRRF